MFLSVKPNNYGKVKLITVFYCRLVGCFVLLFTTLQVSEWFGWNSDSIVGFCSCLQPHVVMDLLCKISTQRVLCFFRIGRRISPWLLNKAMPKGIATLANFEMCNSMIGAACVLWGFIEALRYPKMRREKNQKLKDIKSSTQWHQTSIELSSYFRPNVRIIGGMIFIEILRWICCHRSLNMIWYVIRF